MCIDLPTADKARERERDQKEKARGEGEREREKGREGGHNVKRASDCDMIMRKFSIADCDGFW